MKLLLPALIFFCVLCNVAPNVVDIQVLVCYQVDRNKPLSSKNDVFKVEEKIGNTLSKRVFVLKNNPTENEKNIYIDFRKHNRESYPLVPRVIFFGHDGTNNVFAMDFCGISLEQLLTYENMTPDHVVAFAISAFHALISVHNVDVIMYDLNARRLLYNPEDGKVYIAGFEDAIFRGKKRPNPLSELEMSTMKMPAKHDIPRCQEGNRKVRIQDDDVEMFIITIMKAYLIAAKNSGKKPSSTRWTDVPNDYINALYNVRDLNYKPTLDYEAIQGHLLSAQQLHVSVSFDWVSYKKK